MKTWTETPTLAALAVLFTLPLAGCTEDGPDVAAVPEPAPGDPAIYAPDGWPLQIGDRVSLRRKRELVAAIPGLGAVEGINVVKGVTYGARWKEGPGFLPDEDLSTHNNVLRRKWGLPGYHYVYEGHFPAKVADTFWQYERERLPEHLHERISYFEVVKEYDRYGRPDRQQEWEAERARMRAGGLLPTPAQMSPERKR